MKDKNSPRWWNNEKRTRRAVVDALHTIIERLDEIKELILRWEKHRNFITTIRESNIDKKIVDDWENKINITFNIKRAPNSLNSVQVTFDGVGGGDITTTETTGGTTTTAGAY